MATGDNDESTPHAARTSTRISWGLLLSIIIVGGLTVVQNISVMKLYAYEEEAALNYNSISSTMDSKSSLLSISASESCPLETKRNVFDPFEDIAFSSPMTSTNSSSNGDDPSTIMEKEEKVSYSSYHCVSTGSVGAAASQADAGSYQGRRPNFVSRSCKYRNLYYRVADQSFHYFPSPIEQKSRHEIWQAGDESAKQVISNMEVSIGHVLEEMKPEDLVKFNVLPWKPTVHEEDPPPSMSTISKAGPSNLKFLLYQPFHSMNFGHLLWDDMMALYSLLHIFGYAKHDHSDIQPVPFFVEYKGRRNNYGGGDPSWRCHPSNPIKYVKCVRMYRKFYPAFLGVQPDVCTGDIMRTGNWLLGEDMIGAWPHHPKEVCNQTKGRINLPWSASEYILLPEVLAGTGRLGHFSCVGDCALGRRSQWEDFRGFLFRNVFGPHEGCLLNQAAPAGYITFSTPSGSTRPKEVHWFEQEIELAREKYGDAVRVVDLASLNIQEQLEIVNHSVVFLTNHGGGSASSVFLPTGAGAMLFWIGGTRRDYNFYESAGYFRTMWISGEERLYVNRTMALIDLEVEKSSLVWPNILAAKGLQR